MPGLFVDDKLNLENQFEYKSNDIEKNLNSSNNLQDRLDNILLLMKEKQPPIEKNNTKKSIELIPNNPFLNYEKIDEEIETADIYIDDSYTDNYSKFLPLSTDDRKYFKIEINGGDLIAFKSPSLTTVDVSKTQLKESLNNIFEDLNANKKDFADQQNKRRNFKRIKKLKNFIDKIDSAEKEEIEEKINKPSWLASLLEDQLINQEDIISP